jgi:integrase
MHITNALEGHVTENHEAEAVHNGVHSNRRAKRKKHTFTELWLQRLKPPEVGQELHWDSGDKGQAGLSVLVSSGGTKTFRASFYLKGGGGRRCDLALGRVGEMTLEQARALTRGHREKAEKQGIDPRKKAHRPVEQQGGQQAERGSFRYVVDEFIELHCKPRQRTWIQTKAILTNNCAPLMGKRFADITKQDLKELLHGFIREGHHYKAKVCHAWLRTLFRYAAEEDYVPASIMETVRLRGFVRRDRKRKDDSDPVYTDAEVAACWRAADQLSAVEGSYVKLLILLAPRKSALAGMTRSQLKFDDANNPTEWTTPFELTKSRKSTAKERRRTYVTPLPPLAARILKGVLRADSEQLVFTGLPRTGDRFFGKAIRRRLIKAGAPADFGFHMWRHTVATYLQKEGGHSEWEVGQVLNHSGRGVTAGYVHGQPVDLKRQLLTKWADHVQDLVQPEGAALLR